MQQIYLHATEIPVWSVVLTLGWKKPPPQNCRATLGFTIKDLHSPWISSYSHAPSVSVCIRLFLFIYFLINWWFMRCCSPGSHVCVSNATFICEAPRLLKIVQNVSNKTEKKEVQIRRRERNRQTDNIKPFIHALLVKNLCEMSLPGRFGSSEMPSKARQYVNWAQYTCQMCQTAVFSCIQCHSEHDCDHPRPSAKFGPHSPDS